MATKNSITGFLPGNSFYSIFHYFNNVIFPFPSIIFPVIRNLQFFPYPLSLLIQNFLHVDYISALFKCNNHIQSIWILRPQTYNVITMFIMPHDIIQLLYTLSSFVFIIFINIFKKSIFFRIIIFNCHRWPKSCLEIDVNHIYPPIYLMLYCFFTLLYAKKYHWF